jgi:(E)-4-hydroxy-3-methyl-but-2-enyl pyrophosphate reductase
MDILLANPRGFCAGVERAIAIVERALEIHGAPIYVRHEVVHNKFVVDGLRAKGAVFVEELDEVPDGATVIFSAHGVSQAVRSEAERRGLRVFDATCPLVTKVHSEVQRLRLAGREVVMIGHRGHPEVEGTMGQAAGGMHLVENVEDVAKLRVQDEASSPTSRRLRFQSTMHAPSFAARGAIPQHHRTAQGRHLLRHAESPGCRQAAGRAVRSGDRCRLAQQFEFQPAARSCSAPRS